MENVHIQHREKAKPYSNISSPIALSFLIYKKLVFSLFTKPRNSAGCQCDFAWLCVQAVSIHARSFPLCWLKWVRIHLSNTNTYTNSNPGVCITPITSGRYTILTVWRVPWHYYSSSLNPCHNMGILLRHWVHVREEKGTCFLNAPHQKWAWALSQGQGSDQG